MNEKIKHILDKIFLIDKNVSSDEIDFFVSFLIAFHLDNNLMIAFALCEYFDKPKHSFAFEVFSYLESFKSSEV